MEIKFIIYIDLSTMNLSICILVKKFDTEKIFYKIWHRLFITFIHGTILTNDFVTDSNIPSQKLKGKGAR